MIGTSGRSSNTLDLHVNRLSLDVEMNPLKNS